MLLPGASVLAYELPVLVVEGEADKNRVGVRLLSLKRSRQNACGVFVPKVRWVLVLHRSHATRFACAAGYRG